MANGPSHPNEQLTKRRSSGASSNGTKKRAALADSHEEDVKQPPAVRGNGPIGPNEQAAATVDGDTVEPPAPLAKGRGKNGAGAQADVAAKRLRFNVSIQARLAKGTDFAVCVFSPESNRGPVIIESIHVGVYRKGESVFGGDVPIRKEAKINPGTRKVLPFSDAQKKELSGVLKSKTFALVTAVYTAPTKTAVTFSIENEDAKKK